jgi:hypothetical protein
MFVRWRPRGWTHVRPDLSRPAFSPRGLFLSLDDEAGPGIPLSGTADSRLGSAEGSSNQSPRHGLIAATRVEPLGQAEGSACSYEGDVALLHGLAERIQSVATKLGQLVEDHSAVPVGPNMRRQALVLAG